LLVAAWVAEMAVDLVAVRAVELVAEPVAV